MNVGTGYWHAFFLTNKTLFDAGLAIKASTSVRPVVRRKQREGMWYQRESMPSLKQEDFQGLDFMIAHNIQGSAFSQGSRFHTFL